MKAAIITVSDSRSAGGKPDTAGAAVEELIRGDYEVTRKTIVPDEFNLIAEEIKKSSELADLVLTVGGTGFSKRDVTPEATRSVIERETPGLAETMRAKSLAITNRAMLSRAVSGIRGNSLIINLPGSKKAAVENLSFVYDALAHGLETLRSEGSTPHPRVAAVCVGEKKGEFKKEFPVVFLKENFGIQGDAHAGSWHRQISLLAVESVDKIRSKVNIDLVPGIFAENILVEGIELNKLPVGAKLKIGQSTVEVTQIGKECNSDCAIRKAAGDCVMPREGIFARVLISGAVKAGDEIIIM
jgi:molybdenum cofactor synthesis domain-containing protein